MAECMSDHNYLVLAMAERLDQSFGLYVWVTDIISFSASRNLHCIWKVQSRKNSQNL